MRGHGLNARGIRTLLLIITLLVIGGQSVFAQSDNKGEMGVISGKDMKGGQSERPQPSPTPQAGNSKPRPSPTPKKSGGHDHDGHDQMNMNSQEQKEQKEQKEKSGDTVKPAEGMNSQGTSGTGMVPAESPDASIVMTGKPMDGSSSSGSRNTINMGTQGSGTSWQPGSTPMYMWYKRAKGWLVFFHGDVKVGVNSQGGPRGMTKFESQNWFMPMAYRRVGPGTLQLRGMFSFEPFTFSGKGSPQLFQTGELYKGQPIVDAQHPHDFVMELSATYTIPMGERASWFAYVGYPGEPALGPVAFMHRWSASENPSAPLSHHLQDATHITFGVFTTGFTYRWFKLEASVFNGREPDENRYNFEAGPWNSRSLRLSFVPNKNWAMQVSYGLLKNPEPYAPGDVRRTTASIQYNKPFNRGNWATSLVWGRNSGTHGDQFFKVNSYLAESTVQFLDKNYVYTRLELVDKNELLGDEDLKRVGLSHSQHPIFRIGAYTFGYARDVFTTEKFSVAVGGDFTLYSKPAILDPIYGERPTSYKAFMRFRLGRKGINGHDGHEH